MSRHVIIVEDEATTVESEGLLKPGGMAGLCFERKDWSWPTIERLKSCAAQLIVANAAGNWQPLLQLLSSVRDAGIQATTLAIVSQSAPADLFSAVARAADDFVIWPPCFGEFAERIGRLLGPEQADRSQWNIPAELNRMVGEDAGFLHLVQQVPLLAKAQVPVLVTGETGTGKELFAH